MKDLNCAKTVATDSASADLVDIRSVCVDKTLPREARIAEFVRQMRDPYHFKCGNFEVHASFSEDGATLEECLKCLLL